MHLIKHDLPALFGPYIAVVLLNDPKKTQFDFEIQNNSLLLILESYFSPFSFH